MANSSLFQVSLGFAPTHEELRLLMIRQFRCLATQQAAAARMVSRFSDQLFTFRTDHYVPHLSAPNDPSSLLSVFVHFAFNLLNFASNCSD